MKPVNRVAILPNLRKSGVVRLLQEAVSWLESRGMEVVTTGEAAGQISRPDLEVDPGEWWRHADMVLSLGGDGTVLSAAGLVSKHPIPVLGVNLGSLGFLTDVGEAELYSTLERLMKGEYEIERRMALQAAVMREGKEVGRSYALNDVVVATGAFSRVITLTTWVSGHEVSEYQADGIIIATPTGSTAYSLASGGPVVHPGVETILIAPICAHTLGVRPVIVSAQETVTIEFSSDVGNVMLTADGQRGFDLKPGDRIVVHKAARGARLVRTSKASFYNRLRTKLRWV